MKKNQTHYSTEKSYNGDSSRKSEKNLCNVSEDDDYEEYKPLKIRKLEKLTKCDYFFKQKEHVLMNKPSIDHEKETNKLTSDATISIPGEHKQSLLVKSQKLRAEASKKKLNDEEEEIQHVIIEEQRILDQVQRSMSTPLISVKERAKGIIYENPIVTSWTLPKKYKDISHDDVEKLRDMFLIDVSGPNIPPPIQYFDEMRLPKCIIKALKKKKIVLPSQIQMQGLPAALLGRDLMGIAFTGSGKTIVFTLPMILQSLEYEMRSPFFFGEGPYGLVICPSRELAMQTYSTVEYFCKALANEGYPLLRSICMIGGTSVLEQSQKLRCGLHIVIATPGRLNHMLMKRRLSLEQCMFLTLDEADRLIDYGFEDDVRNILDYFQHQRQTLLFSATMPRKMQEFARSALVQPIVVNVGRAGAANLDVVQEVEYVKREAKLPYLLDCLQKTGPPVVVFCENKKNADDVHEYLLLKGVDAVAIHGGLSQEERREALQEFREGKKDVLIGTDVASKGLDFPAIQHVINFDMPKEIENYVHRIGRTGRCGRTGVATTFINKHQDETILLDLKALLMEAGQKIPPFLEAFQSTNHHSKEIGGIRGCAFCGGLGHRITQCTKLDSQKNKKNSGKGKDFLTTGSRYTGTAAYTGDW